MEDEVIKIREEDIHEAIREKEKAALASMSLNELRGLSADKEIKEQVGGNPLPGEQGLGGVPEEPLPGVGGPPPPMPPPPGPPPPNNNG